jgi:hypothetical protein
MHARAACVTMKRKPIFWTFRTCAGAKFDDGAEDEIIARDLEKLTPGRAISIHKAQRNAFRRGVIPMTASRLFDRALLGDHAGRRDRRSDRRRRTPAPRRRQPITGAWRSNWSGVATASTEFLQDRPSRRPLLPR